MRFGTFTLYKDKTTGKFVQYSLVNEGNKHKYYPLEHNGFFQNYNGHNIVALYTTDKFTTIRLEKKKIMWNNFKNFYFDNRHINTITIFDSSMFNYYKFEENSNKFMNFFIKHSLKSELNTDQALKWIMMEYYHAVYNSFKNDCLLKVSPTKPNEFVKIKGLKEESFKYLHEDKSFKEDFIQNSEDLKGFYLFMKQLTNF